MIIRSLDINKDWTFGIGKNNYLTSHKAIVQNIETRLLSFFGIASLIWMPELIGSVYLAQSLQSRR